MPVWKTDRFMLTVDNQQTDNNAFDLSVISRFLCRPSCRWLWNTKCRLYAQIRKHQQVQFFNDFNWILCVQWNIWNSLFFCIADQFLTNIKTKGGLSSWQVSSFPMFIIIKSGWTTIYVDAFFKCRHQTTFAEIKDPSNLHPPEAFLFHNWIGALVSSELYRAPHKLRFFISQFYVYVQVLVLIGWDSLILPEHREKLIDLTANTVSFLSSVDLLSPNPNLSQWFSLAMTSTILIVTKVHKNIAKRFFPQDISCSDSRYDSGQYSAVVATISSLEQRNFFSEHNVMTMVTATQSI